MPDAHELLAQCHFPSTTTTVDLAVSGGPDSLGLLLLALDAGLDVSVHHVNHHTRPSSDGDALQVAAVCEGLGVTFTATTSRWPPVAISSPGPAPREDPRCPRAS